MTYTIPSDSHGVGDSGHTTDHNHLADCVTNVFTGHPQAVSGVAWQTLAGSHAARNQQWQAYMASRHYSGQMIAAVGDSFTSGANPPLTSWEQTWPNVFGQVFQGRYPVIGLSTHGRGFLSPLLSGGITPDYVAVSGSGTPNPVKNYGLNLYTYDISHGGGCTLTYSMTGDVFIISYATQTGGGSFTWKINSGSPTTVSTAGSGTSDTGIVFQASGVGAGASYTLTITYTPSTGPCYIDGVVEFSGDESKGVQVYNLGYSGSATADWTGQHWQMLGSLVPSLVVLELGATDWQNVVAPSTVQANLTTIIANIAAACTSQPVSFLLLIPPAPGGISNIYTWSQYAAAMYAVAAAGTNVDVLDLTLRMPVANGSGGPYGLYGTSDELTSAGHSLVADILVSYLGPQ